ncbi:autotransporter outer membrane beta-barrel domain-containing protein, partial [Polymorphobacter sp.]|uniref:autotransporter outer membrane beta-barrel domain-containing protein n=1 Tax=Polymorphobacter sp. TaxID=1909290 RepID=UPI003F70D053
TAATTTTAIGAGGSAYSLLVDAGATLSSITNSGTITAIATGTGNGAYAITDRSGTLASITNSGTITTATGDSAASARAIDLSASSGAVLVTNSGTITGDIVFGSGDATLALTGGSIAGTVAFGSGNNLLALSGATGFAQALTATAPLAITLTDTARLDLSLSTAPLSSISATGASVLVVPVLSGNSGLTLSGAASFTGTSAIELSIQSLAASQRLDILTAAGGISTDHLDTLVNPLGNRFLFTAGTPTITGNALTIDLVRKSAADIGLAGAQAALFDQSLLALPNGSAEAIAIANLGDAASVAAAYRQLTPPSFGRAALRAAQSLTDTGFGAAAERLSLLADMQDATGIERGPSRGLWGQEIGHFSRQRAGTNETAFRNNTFGVAIGADTQLGPFDAVGAALIANWTGVNQAVADGLPDANVSITAIGVQPYAMTSWKGLYAQANALAARVTYSSERAVSIGDVANTVTASWRGYQLGAGLTLGGRFKLGPVRIEPSNSLSWLRLHQGGYSEAGNGNFALGVEAQTDTAATNTTKVSLAWLVPWGEGNLEFQGHGGYVHNFSTTPTETTARFLAGGDSMILTGDAIGRTGKIFGGGAGYRSDFMTFRARYDRRQESGYTENAIVASLGLAF